MTEPCIDCGLPSEEGSPWCVECNTPIFVSPRKSLREFREGLASEEGR